MPPLPHVFMVRYFIKKKDDFTLPFTAGVNGGTIWLDWNLLTSLVNDEYNDDDFHRDTRVRL
jgi:hypothetical protein